MARPQRFCIFCDGPGLSKTHIWPDWLNRLLRPPSLRLEELDNPRIISNRKSKFKQGSIFSQKPYLCCIKCNTGWMRKFEDEMSSFAKPIFAAPNMDVVLDDTKQRIFAAWLALVAILAEYIDHKGSVCVSKEDRIFLKTRLMPPEDNWTIAACSLSGQKWTHRYRHHSLFIGEFSSVIEYQFAVEEGRTNNTQIASFGMGQLFVQVFSCPNLRLVSSFRDFGKASGLTQIWPIERGFWPLPRRLPKFPTQTVLNDDAADILADDFNERIKILTRPPPSLGGPL